MEDNQVRILVCPGSFDPVTSGHVDIFERAAKISDLLIVAVFHNPNKNPLFSMDERVEMLKAATAHIPNIEVDAFSGLLNEYVRKRNSSIIVRGLRAFSDFEYEFQRALLMKKLNSEIETIFIMTNNEYSFVSSSGIKELAKFGGNITGLVPAVVQEKITKRIAEV
jgi:pantetheine-phosphate adenylyltransferase